MLFFFGSIAGFINVMAGGGSAITLPILIFLGLDSALANGTNRVAILVQNISAVASFKREQVSHFKLSLKLSLFTLPGAIIGAIAAVKIGDELFRNILGGVMIFIVISMLFPKAKNAVHKKFTEKIPWSVYPVMFAIGFYGGFVQVGVGFILMAALHYLLKLELLYVNMHKVFIVFIYTIPAMLIFIFTGNVNWIYGLALAAGNATGAWWSAKVSVKKGDKVIKLVLSAAVLIMAMKLFGLF
jgi:hypothetical protein